VHDKAPLKALEISGLDAPTFEMAGSSYWYADKNRVYVGLWSIVPSAEIDRNSIEVLSLQVVKDKNHVYYFTREFKTEEHEANKKDSYAILEGADAPSFRRIDDRNYEDKNTTWTIRQDGEEIHNR
jgi:hypothetical protein